MKKIAKIILQYYLYVLAKIVLWRTRPFIIAVAGTINKTFTKQAIESLLRAQGVTLVVPSFNTEIGLPLAILGLKSGYNSYQRWFKSALLAPFKALTSKLPKVVVFEFGADRPGDLAYLISLAPPKIVVITAITQRYLEQFSDIDKMAHEYEILVKKVKPNGLVVLNADIPEVRKLQSVSQAKVVFFSVTEDDVQVVDNTWAISNFEITANGLTGYLINGNQKTDFHLPRFGRHHALAYSAAQAVVSKLLADKII